MAPGETRQVPFMPSPFIRRLAHRPLQISTASIQRLAQPETVLVPAGTFRTIVYVVRPADGREGRFSIEADSPHRLVRWAWTRPAGAEGEGPGRSSEGLDTGELIGSDRIAYWRLHDPGDEKILERFGLQPRVR
jgi:hypothetical protein